MLKLIIVTIILSLSASATPRQPINIWARERLICPPSFEQFLISADSPRFQELLLYAKKNVGNFTLIGQRGECGFHRISNISIFFDCNLSAAGKAFMKNAGLTCETGRSKYKNVTKYVKNRCLGIVEMGKEKSNAGFIEYAIGYRNRNLKDMLMYIAYQVGTILTYSFDFYSPSASPIAEYYIDHIEAYVIRLSYMNPNGLDKLRAAGMA